MGILKITKTYPDGTVKVTEIDMDKKTKEKKTDGSDVQIKEKGKSVGKVKKGNKKS